MNVTSLNPTNSNQAADGQLRAKFDQFVGESMFGQMLKSMRESTGKPAYFHGGRAEEVFQSQLDQLLVSEISEASAEQISDPMFELFTANMNAGQSSAANTSTAEEAQEAIGQLEELQRRNQAQSNETDSAAMSRLDLSI
ncbi:MULTISPECIES: rod-binding protein [Bremerella]|uniref:rod-binding protein n=1 Tax=Bremerella TaxID=2714594 RepID=UPI0031EE5BB6